MPLLNRFDTTIVAFQLVNTYVMHAENTLEREVFYYSRNLIDRKEESGDGRSRQSCSREGNCTCLVLSFTIHTILHQPSARLMIQRRSHICS